jgi:hypothetical protein
MGYTTAELITAIRDQFGEDTEATSAVTNNQILGFANQAQREICWNGNILLTCASTKCTAGQEEYPVPGDYLKICSVSIYRADGLKVNLKPISVQERDAANPQSDRQWAYYVWGVNANGVNEYHIGLQEIPATTALVDDLHIWYRQAPSTMTLAGVSPEIPDHFQDCLIDGALLRVYGRLAPRDAKWLALYDRKVASWRAWLLEAKRYVNPLGFDQPRQIRDTAMYSVDRSTGIS